MIKGSCLFFSLLLSFQLFALNYTLFSPDKNIQVTVSVNDKLTWMIKYKNEIVLQPGELGISFEHGPGVRKNGNKWYIGAMTDAKRDLKLLINFLDGKSYTMTFLADGLNADRHASDYTINKLRISNGDNITVSMEKGGGWVAVLVPEN